MAKSCTYPVIEATPYRKYMAFVIFKQFVKDAPNSGLEFEAQKRFLGALRDMGGRIATGEPREFVTLEVGAVFRRQSSHALVDVLQRNGRNSEAMQARNVEAADLAWRQAIKKVSDQTMNAGGALDADKLLQKYGFTPEDARAYDTGQTPTPSAQEKMRKMSAEMDQTQRELAEKLLKDMPH